MNNNVLIIGNGFDLAHGMKTKYEHFIEYLKEVQYKNDDELCQSEKNTLEDMTAKNGFIKYLLNLTQEVPGWVDFEREILRITNQFTKFFEIYKDAVGPNNRVSQKVIGELMVDLFIDFGIAVRGELGLIIQPMFYSKKYGLNKREIMKVLRGHLDMLVRGLEIYLQRCQREFVKNADNKYIEQIQAIGPKYVISFNYTETYKIYSINPEYVFHIHGRLGRGNMVLGYDDRNPNELDFVYFKKYFQRIQKLTGNLDEGKFYTNNSGTVEAANVHFYGHSMDKTDGDIIEQVASLANSFVIYVYDQEDYEQKVINLIDVFGKEEATRKIQSGFIKFVKCE